MEKLGDNLGANIFILRSRAGLSQEDLGFEIGVSRQMISKWELNEAKPRTNNMEKLCKALNVSMNQLLGKEEVLTQNDLQEIVEQIKNEKENVIDINKIREDLHIIEDIKNEVERVRKEHRKRRKAREKKITLITVAVLIVLYIAYSLYKYIIITDINKKVAQYQNADNYYCEIKMYENEAKVEHIFIWKKGEKIKIETISYNKVGDEILHSTRWVNIDLLQFTRYDFKTKELLKDKQIDNNTEVYQAASMYGNFPDIIRGQMETIMSTIFKCNKVYLSYYGEQCDLNINDSKVQLNVNTYLPNTYIYKEKEITKKSCYKIELNNIQDKDVVFNEDSIK